MSKLEKYKIASNLKVYVNFTNENEFLQTKSNIIVLFDQFQTRFIYSLIIYLKKCSLFRKSLLNYYKKSNQIDTNNNNNKNNLKIINIESNNFSGLTVVFTNAFCFDVLIKPWLVLIYISCKSYLYFLLFKDIYSVILG
jgi:hypothetical protein